MKCLFVAFFRNPALSAALLLLVLAGANRGFSALLEGFSGVAAEEVVLELANAEIHGFHFVPGNDSVSKGQPLLLTHGIGMNVHEFEALIPALVAAGFDCYAFNFRGHGNDLARSQVLTYAAGEYGFDAMVEADFPAMVDFIYRATGKKVAVLGHSMGGMIPRAALIRGTVDPNRVSSLVLLGSPPFLRTSTEMPGALQAVATESLMAWTLWDGPGSEPINISQVARTTEAILRFTSVVHPFFSANRGWTEAAIQFQHRRTRAAENFGPSDGWLDRAFSHQTPKDIYRSMVNFAHKGYPYDRSIFDIPVLHVGGSLDLLAPWNDIVEGAWRQSRHAGYWLTKLDGVSHLDLVATSVVARYIDIVRDFLATRAPRGSGAESCANLLLGNSGRLYGRVFQR